MEKQHTTDNKFYIVLVIAIFALIIGAAGLVISIQRPAAQGLSPEGTNIIQHHPSGSADDMKSTIEYPFTGNGVVESPKKN